ncbi:MAG: hypothetical protein FWC54_03025 [Actinomycetia bacterium]|nr:hypothetical protein [Actinomycetes bacterium]
MKTAVRPGQAHTEDERRYEQRCHHRNPCVPAAELPGLVKQTIGHQAVRLEEVAD